MKPVARKISKPMAQREQGLPKHHVPTPERKKTPSIRVQVNIPAVLGALAAYTYICFALASSWFTSQQQEHLEVSEKNSQALIERLEQNEDRMVLRMVASQKANMNSMAKKMQMMLNQREGEWEKKLEEKDVKILELKERIRNLIPIANHQDQNKERETIAYSQASMNMLRFEHRQKVTRLKETFKNQERALISSLDLDTQEGRSVLQDFRERKDREIYALQVQQAEERNSFYRNKYRVALD